MNKISSGVPGLDGLCNGGFEKGSCVLVTGGTGTGKTVLATQFLLGAFSHGHETVIYISFEEDKDRFYSHMLSFGWDLAAYEARGQFVFLKYKPEHVLRMVEDQSREIEHSITELGASRVVIDSLSSYVSLFDSEVEKRKMLVALFDHIRTWKCTTLVTEEVDMTPKQFTSGVISLLSDSVIVLYHEHRSKTTRGRGLEVLKMRGSGHRSGVYSMSISEIGVGVDVHTHIF